MAWPTSAHYNDSVQNPRQFFADEELQSGEPEADKHGLPKPINGSFASVYSLQCGSRRWAVRCFTREQQDYQYRYEAISAHLQHCQLPYTVDFEFLNKGILVSGVWYPIVKMEWVDGQQLNKYVGDNCKDSDKIAKLADRWIELIKTLRSSKLAHGDLQHGNVLIVGGNLRLVDYDGMYVPKLAGSISHETGHPSYQHPERTGTVFNETIDRFSCLTIYVALRALVCRPQLWEEFDNEDNLLFGRADFRAPESSRLFQKLLAEPSPELHFLAKTLYDACRKPIHQVPWLTELQVPGVSAAVKPDWIDDFLPKSVSPLSAEKSSGKTLQSETKRQNTEPTPIKKKKLLRSNVSLVGGEIEHETFGHGTIVATAQSGEETVITVLFDAGEEKKLLAIHRSVVLVKLPRKPKTSAPTNAQPSPATGNTLATSAAKPPALSTQAQAAIQPPRPIRTAVKPNPALSTKPGEQDKYSPLHQACLKKQVHEVAKLLDGGAYPALINKMGHTPLHCAAIADFPEGAELLLAHHVNVNRPDESGRTPLHLAAQRGHIAIARVLLRAGANVDARDKAGKTPQDMAVTGGHTQLCDLLGPTPLTVPPAYPTTSPPVKPKQAAKLPLTSTALPLATVVIGPGADFRAGVTACDVERVRACLNKDATLVNHTDSAGKTALLEAVQARDLKMVQLLMEYGADATQASPAGLTPIAAASAIDAREIQKALSGQKKTGLLDYLIQRLRRNG